MHNTISYSIRKSSRTKRVSISINSSKEVILTIPTYVSEKVGIDFLNEKMDWIQKKLKNPKVLKTKIAEGTREEYLKNKETARKLTKEKLEFFGKLYGLSYNKIAIKQQKTRWGSCSKKGNLNFNYKIIFLPKELQDYLIVHELCHLKEMNHSIRFWKLVERTIPNYKECRKQLRNID